MAYQETLKGFCGFLSKAPKGGFYPALWVYQICLLDPRNRMAWVFQNPLGCPFPKFPKGILESQKTGVFWSPLGFFGRKPPKKPLVLPFPKALWADPAFGGLGYQNPKDFGATKKGFWKAEGSPKGGL